MKKQQKNAVNERKGDQMGVLAMFLVAGGLVLIYHLVVGQPTVAEATHSGAAKGIVVVDSKTVLKGFMDEMQEKISNGTDFTEGQLNMSGQEFGAEYMRAIKKYRDKGYLVIDKQYALGVPTNSEITVEIAEALGLQIEEAADPFSAPSLD